MVPSVLLEFTWDARYVCQVLPDISMRWESTNRKIKSHFTDKEKTFVVDATRLIRYSDNEFWEDDGLHMSELGYDEFGAQLADVVRPMLGIPVSFRNTL